MLECLQPAFSGLAEVGLALACRVHGTMSHQSPPVLDFDILFCPGYSPLFQLVEPYSVDIPNQLPAIQLSITHQVFEVLSHEGMDGRLFHSHDDQVFADEYLTRLPIAV